MPALLLVLKALLALMLALYLLLNPGALAGLGELTSLKLPLQGPSA